MKKYQEFGSFQHRLLERIFVGIIHEWLTKNSFQLPQEVPIEQVHQYEKFQYLSVPIPSTIIERIQKTKGLSSEVIQSLTNFFRDNRNLQLWEVEGKRITLKRNNQLIFQKTPRRLRRMRVDIVLYNKEERQFILIDWKFTRQGLHAIYNTKMEKYLVWYNYHQFGGEEGYWRHHQDDKWPFGCGIVFYLNQNQQIGIYHQKAESINIMPLAIGIRFKKANKRTPKSNRICINTQSKGLLELEFDEDW